MSVHSLAMVILLSLPILLVAFRVLRPTSLPQDRVREPTEDERRRIHAALEHVDRVPDRIRIAHEPVDGPPIWWLRERSNATLLVEATFLDRASDRELGIGLTSTAHLPERGYRLRTALGGVLFLDGLVLGLATLLSVAGVRPSGSASGIVFDPVSLALATLGVAATGFVLTRSSRSLLLGGDAAATRQYGTDAVIDFVEAFGSSVPVRESDDESAGYSFHRPTTSQRTAVLASAADAADLPPRSPWQHGAVRIVVGVSSFALAAAVHHADPLESVLGSSSDLLLSVGTGVLVGALSLLGYAVLSNGAPVLWNPTSRLELPPDRPRLLRTWLSVAASGVLLSILLVLVSDGLLYPGWFLLALPVVWAVRRSGALRPIFVPRSWMRRPTQAETKAIEEAYSAFDREPGTVIVFRNTKDWGSVAVTRAFGAKTIWIEESSLDSSATDLEIALAHADERGRLYWQQRGLLPFLTMLPVALLAAALVFVHPSASVRGWLLLALLAALPAIACVSYLARRLVYRADSFASSIFGVDAVRATYDRRGRRLCQLQPVSEQVAPLARAFSPEPLLEQRLDQLDASDGDAT